MRNNIIKIKPCKKVITFDSRGNKKGWLLEIVSDRDKFTKHIRGQIYLTVIKPGTYLDFHMHAGADYFVTCIKGKIEHIVYKNRKQKQIIRMGDGDFKTTFLPRCYPHSFRNKGKGDAYTLIYRYPAWSPRFKEQFDIPKDKIEDSKSWIEINKFKKKFN